MAGGGGSDFNARRALRASALCLASTTSFSWIDLVYASLICSLLRSKSMGPMDSLGRLFDGSPIRAVRTLSVSFILELDVDAIDTGCLGRELRSVGESLGGAAAM